MTGTQFIFLLTLLVKHANILPLSSYTTRRNLWMCFCLCLEFLFPLSPSVNYRDNI